MTPKEIIDGLTELRDNLCKSKYETPTSLVLDEAIAFIESKRTDKSCKTCFHIAYDGDIPYCGLSRTEMYRNFGATCPHYKGDIFKYKKE